MNDLEKKSIECIKNMPIEETTYQVARNVVLDYITNLQEENERLKEINKEQANHLISKDNLSYEDYKSRNEKAIENIDLVIELIKQQPTEDDTWILNRLNGFKYLLQGEDKDE